MKQWEFVYWPFRLLLKSSLKSKFILNSQDNNENELMHWYSVIIININRSSLWSKIFVHHHRQNLFVPFSAQIYYTNKRSSGINVSWRHRAALECCTRSYISLIYALVIDTTHTDTHTSATKITLRWTHSSLPSFPLPLPSVLTSNPL